jgi:RNA 2',3'-cyclic 3'-phosphodiesterase
MSRKATARLFVAVDPPEVVREQLATWALGAALASGLRPENGASGALRPLQAQALHLTLCFMGSRPTHEIEAIGSALDATAGYVGELSVGAPLWLPPKRPRALAVEIHDDAGELGRLHQAVAQAISETTGWKPERRRFKAHITLVRVRARGREAESSIAGQFELPVTPRLCFIPESITLYRSRLAPAGAVYDALATSRLVPAQP